MSQDKPEAGDVWQEKRKRADYPAPRRLRILRVPKTRRFATWSQGGVEITPIEYELLKLNPKTQRLDWVRSRRTMYMFGLLKNWRYVSG